MLPDTGRQSDGIAAGSVIQHRYEVVRALGCGGLATTFLVRDLLVGTNVALKLLAESAPEALEALRFEFAVLRELYHPHLCQVHDFALVKPRADGERQLAFYTAEYVPGPTLAELAEEATWLGVRRPLVDALGALRLLHRAGLRHGDFKPANVLVQREQRGVLIDLSCAQRTDAPPSGRVSGTPDYLAPELLRGESADARADLFAVGRTLLELSKSAKRGLPREVVGLAERLLRDDAEARPADVDEVLEALGVSPAEQVAVPVGIGRLVGRSEQLAAARAALGALAEGTTGPRCLYVCGPEGVGKSRVLREIKWAAQQQFRVVEANCANPGAIDALLRQALGEQQAHGWAGVGALRRAIAASTWTPCVLCVDDLHLLRTRQRQLLLAVVRSLEPTDALLLVGTGPADHDPAGPATCRLELRPLTPEQMDEWLGSTLPASVRTALRKHSGGFPGALRSMVTQLATGALSEVELKRGQCGIALSGPQRARVRALDPEAQRALGALAVLGRATGAGALSQLGVEEAALTQLTNAAIVEHSERGFRLWRWGESEDVLAALDPALVADLHRHMAAWLETRPTDVAKLSESELLARRVLHLALSRDEARARQHLLGSGTLWEAAPGAWAEAARAVASASADLEITIAAAALEREAGSARAARDRLAASKRRSVPNALRAAFHLELGLCHLKLGDASAGESELSRAAEAAQTPELAARAQAALAGSLNKRGRYREALELVDRALAPELPSVLRADLQQTGAVADCFLGNLDPALRRVQEAARLLGSVTHPRRLVRALGTQALVEQQMGRLQSATTHYGAALDLAEQHGLSDQIATAALNLGTALHQRGDWSGALAAYERGLLTSAALGQTNTESLLRFNLSKLYADLGQFDRADLTADRCQALARQGGLDLVAAEAEAVRGEVEMLRGDLRAARRCFEQAMLQFDQHESRRERTEVTVQLGEVLLACQEVDEAMRLLAEVEPELGSLDAEDAKLRWLLVSGRLALARSDAGAAAAAGDQVSREARRLSLPDIEADAELFLSEVWRGQDSPSLAQKHLIRAREIWERAAATLSPQLRDAFWRHPRRQGARSPGAEAHDPAASSRQRKLELLLDINQRLNSSLRTSEILQHTMDAAIQLTGAERGFVLLLESNGSSRTFRVAAARNLDCEQLERSHLKFSRAIAEQVVQSATPVVTANAQTDARFSQHDSVHAMHLQSVVCVPVVSPAGTLGALYLDNRFQANRFRQADVEVLLAFSTQVAIALNNARLHDELRKRNRQLSRERQRVEELLLGQAAEIERLSDEVRRARTTPEQRYDYQGIVGASDSMRQVFSLLDRVIETDLSILIQGESGTGKELFARAIHLNNSQRKGPLVSVNCAALPQTLLESELFGYERGAFTGADRSREGLLVKARGGTLFLDEVAEMPLPMQVKLLRALQEREVRPLGSNRVVPIDIRLVCATNRHLQSEVKRGTFRADLYYRIAGVEATLPPLRDRPEDIPVLVHHLLAAAARRMERSVPELSPPALRKLTQFEWPGNVRQLENVVTKALVMAEGNRITARDVELPTDDAGAATNANRDAFRQHEAERIAAALAENRWNVSRVGRLLGIPRPTLYRKLKRYGLIRAKGNR